MADDVVKWIRWFLEVGRFGAFECLAVGFLLGVLVGMAALATIIAATVVVAK